MSVHARSHRGGARGGFTLVELLVVMAIILLLIGIAGGAFLGFQKRSSATAARSELETIAAGIGQFETDHGYLPPLILDDPTVQPSQEEWCTSVSSRTTASDDLLRRERYHSVYSLAVYLVGVGELDPSTARSDLDRHDGVAGPGFRDPGNDRAWGGAIARTDDTHRVEPRGQTYGPYVNVADNGRLRRADEAGDFPEDAGASLSGDGPWDRMSVLVDLWDRPVRYYRYWPTRALDGSSDSSLIDAPAELLSAEALRAGGGSGVDPDVDASLDPELARGSFALLSAGPDGRFAPAGFAQQGESSGGWASDFYGLDENARRSALVNAFDDNVRVVR